MLRPACHDTDTATPRTKPTARHTGTPTCTIFRTDLQLRQRQLPAGSPGERPALLVRGGHRIVLRDAESGVDLQVIRSLALLGPDALGGLSGSLRRVASLIAAELPTRPYCVSYAGIAFGTHVHQAAPHARLLAYTADAVRGFTEDLKRIGRADDVVVMMFTELGRRVEENASLGTDHGTATPIFVFGTGVEGGMSQPRSQPHRPGRQEPQGFINREMVDRLQELDVLFLLKVPRDPWVEGYRNQWHHSKEGDELWSATGSLWGARLLTIQTRKPLWTEEGTLDLDTCEVGLQVHVATNIPGNHALTAWRCCATSPSVVCAPSRPRGASTTTSHPQCPPEALRRADCYPGRMRNRGTRLSSGLPARQTSVSLCPTAVGPRPSSPTTACSYRSPPHHRCQSPATTARNSPSRWIWGHPSCASAVMVRSRAVAG